MSASANELHRLHVHLEQVLGPEDAATLMARLPATPSTDVATRGDLNEVRRELRSELRDVERRLSEHVDLRVEAAVGRMTRFLFVSMLASQATLVAAVLAAARFA